MLTLSSYQTPAEMKVQEWALCWWPGGPWDSTWGEGEGEGKEKGEGGRKIKREKGNEQEKDKDEDKGKDTEKEKETRAGTNHSSCIKKIAVAVARVRQMVGKL